MGTPAAVGSGQSAVGELLALEALGIANAGKGFDVAMSEKGAVNASGGALPADPIMATGLFRLAETTKQLRALSMTGKGSGKAIVHGTGGVGMQNNCVFNLEV